MANSKVRKAKRDVQSAIRDELQRMDAKYNGLKPSIVVTEAKPKSSPLHSSFEWDDTKAGHEYRLAQARKLIRVIVPVIEVSGERRRDPWIHVPATPQQAQDDGDEGTYRPLSVVVQDPDAFARALSELAAKVRSAQAAAEELRAAASASDNPDGERMARIAMAITALQTAGAAVSALH